LVVCNVYKRDMGTTPFLAKAGYIIWRLIYYSPRL